MGIYVHLWRYGIPWLWGTRVLSWPRPSFKSVSREWLSGNERTALFANAALFCSAVSMSIAVADPLCNIASSFKTAGQWSSLQGVEAVTEVTETWDDVARMD